LESIVGNQSSMRANKTTYFLRAIKILENVNPAISVSSWFRRHMARLLQKCLLSVLMDSFTPSRWAYCIYLYILLNIAFKIGFIGRFCLELLDAIFDEASGKAFFWPRTKFHIISSSELGEVFTYIIGWCLYMFVEVIAQKVWFLGYSLCWIYNSITSCHEFITIKKLY